MCSLFLFLFSSSSFYHSTYYIKHKTMLYFRDKRVHVLLLNQTKWKQQRIEQNCRWWYYCFSFYLILFFFFFISWIERGKGMSNKLYDCVLITWMFVVCVCVVYGFCSLGEYYCKFLYCAILFQLRFFLLLWTYKVSFAEGIEFDLLFHDLHLNSLL